MSPEEEIQNYRCVIDDLMNQIERMKRSGRRKREEFRQRKSQRMRDLEAQNRIQHDTIEELLKRLREK